MRAERVARGTFAYRFHCRFWCIMCSPGTANSFLSHAYILTYIPIRRFEMKNFTPKPTPKIFTIYREVDVRVSLVSLIKLGDASIKSFCSRCGDLFLLVPPAKERKKTPDEKAREWHPRIPRFRHSVLFSAAPPHTFAASITVQSKHTCNL